MRILLLNQAFYPDVVATAQMGHDLAKHLVSQGHEVYVVCSRSIYGQKGAVLPRRETVDGIRIYRVGFNLFSKGRALVRTADYANFYFLAGIRTLLLPRMDVTIGFTTPPFISLLAWLLKAWRGTRYIQWVMDLFPDLPFACGVLRPETQAGRFFEALNRFSLRHADRAVVLGRCMEELICSKGVPASKLARIHVWSATDNQPLIPRDANPLRKQWGLEGKFVVMYSGNFGMGHDADTLCNAMKRLAGETDLMFVFIGGGKRHRQIEEYARTNGITNVQFRPYQPRETLAESLSLADVHMICLREKSTGVMIPSKTYGIMAAERPAVFVGSPHSEVARILTEEDCGVCVRCGEDERLAEALLTLKSDPSRVVAMGQRAKAAVRKYDRQSAYEAWDAVIASVTGKKGATQPQ